MARKTVYAVRDVETKERLTYRYRSFKEAFDLLPRFDHTGRVVEVYRTTQDFVTMADAYAAQR